jgi:hypothetical protein
VIAFCSNKRCSIRYRRIQNKGDLQPHWVIDFCNTRFQIGLRCFDGLKIVPGLFRREEALNVTAEGVAYLTFNVDGADHLLPRGLGETF